ncbi:uncharacterized protein LOC127714688 [Mytilus californianus]|uniref:uncharacterized protein LOC127714688 n=1 Tax=Mytilus californianus TaxID=6549 RepID=UPI002247CB22|nr:uncharacterized protein LOC127714688 [Mytilus californianus]
MGLTYIVCFFLLMNHSTAFASTTGTCNAVQSALSGGKLIYFHATFCCDNFEKVEGVCKACNTGFISQQGGMCYPCPSPTYGYRCASVCRCKGSQRCHNVDGCTDLRDNPSTSERLETTISRKQGSSQTAPVVTTEALPLTSWLIISPRKEEGLGLINTEIFIYSLCGVSTFLILSFSIVCLCVYKKSQKANVNQHFENQHTDGNNRQADIDVDLEISQNISAEKETGHEYEEIDERKMSDFSIISSLEQGDLRDNDNSSESSDGIRLPNDGYLNPYQPLQSTLQQSEDSHSESDEYKHSSKENRAYANLYQSLKCNREEKIRLYSRCHSAQYLQLVDGPIQNKNDPNIKENSKRHVKTL